MTSEPGEAVAKQRLQEAQECVGTTKDYLYEEGFLDEYSLAQTR